MPSVAASDVPSLVPSSSPSGVKSQTPSSPPTALISSLPSYVVSTEPSGLSSSQPSIMASTMPSSELETGMECHSNLASFNQEFGVPACPTVGMGCTSEGTDLHVGRGGLGGDATSNTLDSCVDGTSGSYKNDESNESVEITSGDGRLVAGKEAYVVAKVYAWSSGSSDWADFYYTTNPKDAAPIWTRIGGSKQTPSGQFHFLRSDNFTIPAVQDQAVRVVFRYGGSASPCPSGGYNDIDDLMVSQ